MSPTKSLLTLIGLSLMAGLVGPVASEAQSDVPTAASDREPEGSEKPRARLEGTWLITEQFVDPPGSGPFKVLVTFLPGRSDDEGTLVHTNEFELTPNPICTPDQGVWRRTRRREFIATHFNFCFDQTSYPPGNPAGPTKVRDAIELSRDGEELDIREHFESFDPHGNPLFAGTAVGHGVRLRAEAPPPP